MAGGTNGQRSLEFSVRHLDRPLDRYSSVSETSLYLCALKIIILYVISLSQSHLYEHTLGTNKVMHVFPRSSIDYPCLLILFINSILEASCMYVGTYNIIKRSLRGCWYLFVRNTKRICIVRIFFNKTALH